MSQPDPAKAFAKMAMKATGGRGVEAYDPNAIVRLCQNCRQPIEADRVAWHAPTCSNCAAAGCPVPWRHGAPLRRCDACDCMPPDSFLIPAALRPRIRGKLRLKI